MSPYCVISDEFLGCDHLRCELWSVAADDSARARDAMVAGDDACKADAFIREIGVAYEYDEAVWHPDTAKDVRKTVRLLAHDPNLLVLRLRVHQQSHCGARIE